MFKHALIQDAAYQSLLRSTRQQYHQSLAQVLVERFSETAETQPELLAHHYIEAGLSAQAIPYWQRAGQRALQRSAYAEAIGHLTTGLEVLQTLPDTPERAQHELALHVALGRALIGTKSYSAPEVEHSFARARALCQQLGETPEQFEHAEEAIIHDETLPVSGSTHPHSRGRRNPLCADSAGAARA